MFRVLALAALLLAPTHLSAQTLPRGQGEAEFAAWLSNNPGARAQVLSFESWQAAAGVAGVLPTWQVIRTASMWQECAGPPFEIPPPNLWPGMTRTLRFIRDHVKPALGDVDAVSGYRNPALNACAGGSPGSAHQGYFALDLVPRRFVERPQLFRILCGVHARSGRAYDVGLGFYAFQRFHIDTRSFRRWGAAGPNGNESPCALIERGQNPEPPQAAAPAPSSTSFPPPAPPVATQAPPVPAPAPTPSIGGNRS